MTSTISPKPFNFSELTENTKELDQLKPTIMSYLHPEDQVSLQPFWRDSFDSNLGLFARIQSIVGLAFHDIELLTQSKFLFPSVLERFNEELDPSGKVLGEYLSILLQLNCRKGSKEMIAFLKKISSTARAAIQSLNLGYFGNLFNTDEDIISVLELCPNFTSLNIANNIKLSGECLTKVPYKLKKLDIAKCEQLNRNAVQQFLSKVTELEELNLSELDITEEELQSLNTSKLKKLHLNKCKNLNIAALQTLLSNVPLLEELSLSGVDITGEELLALDLSKLKAIDLSFCEELSAEALKEFFKRSSNLERLTLSGTDITGEELLSLDPSKLKAIDLSCCENLNLKALKDFFERIPKLEELDLPHTDITGEELLALNTSKLKKLDLQSCENLNLKALKDFFKSTTELKKLYISGTSIKGDELAMPGLSELNDLHIGGYCYDLNLEALQKFLSKAAQLRLLFLPPGITSEELQGFIPHQCITL
ncbi:MAG: hypothetical protein PVI40_09310 [Chlamydiota bacterium]|jgi:hypothetical protein